MSPKKNLFLLLFLPGLIALVGLACNMPLTSDSGVSQNDLIKTAAAQTLQAQVEDINQNTATLAAATQEPLPGQATPTTGLLSTATLTPDSPVPSASPTSPLTSVCNQAGFVKDISVPDNPEFPPGQTFEKTWRLKNTGTCTWNTSYILVVDGQNPLSAPGSSLLSSKAVLPGETVDVSVNLKAPDTVGTYRNNFKLRSDGGEVFGIGSGNKAFWAQIEVIVATGLTYDFNVKASEATWTSGTGKDKENDLSYGGDVADPNGTATVVEGVVLENKNTSGKILLTIPKRTDNGYIQGVYPAYLVQPGDRLKGRVGFMIPSGSGVCGDGKLKFEVHYFLNDKKKSLGEWTATCDGSLTLIDVDLSPLKGNSIQFILVVRSVGPFLDNFGIWNSFGVIH